MHPDDRADYETEEARFDLQRAHSTVEAMEEFLAAGGKEHTGDDDSFREDRAEMLAGRFVSLLKSHNDHLASAICSRRFEPDQDHVKLDAEHVRMDDRNQQEMYVLHPECYRRLTGGWMEPA